MSNFHDSKWEHLREIRMNYFDHFWRSLEISIIMFRGSIMAFVHALIPDLFVKSSTDTTTDLNNILFPEKPLLPLNIK